MSYQVHSVQYGQYVTGSIPVTDAIDLMNKDFDVLGKACQLDYVIDYPIAWKLGATLVIVHKDNIWSWRKELGITQEWIDKCVKEFEDKDK